MEIATNEEESYIQALVNQINENNKTIIPTENEKEDDEPKEIKPGESGYAGGSYDDPYIPVGFKHKEGTWNNGYTIIGETESIGNEFVWVPCVTSANSSTIKDGDTVVTFKKITTGKYSTDNVNITGDETNSKSEEIESSVGVYGGFYIAKYEASIQGTVDNASLKDTKDGVTETDGSVKPLSQAGKGVWNYISLTEALSLSKVMIDSEKTGVKSTLISGACWDTTLQWMVNASNNKNNEPNKGYDTDSKEKGWFSDVSNNTVHTTGYYAVNNIYDMAGNVWEYTSEKSKYNGNDYVVKRGGRYDTSGEIYPAANRLNSGKSEIWKNGGFRVVLYK